MLPNDMPTGIQPALLEAVDQAVIGPDGRAAEEAVARYRVLAMLDPAAYEYPLAKAMGQLGSRLAQANRRAQALGHIEEAVDRYRRLTQADSDRRSEFVDSLYNLGLVLLELESPDRALPVVAEAVALYRERAQADPAADDHDVPGALRVLGNVQTTLGLHRQALASFEESIALYREQDRGHPGRRAEFISTLIAYGAGPLREMARFDDGIAAVEEAIGLLRELLASDDAAWAPALAKALHNLGVLMSESGRAERAVALYTEAAALLRWAVRSGDDEEKSTLAVSLKQLVAELSKSESDEQALAPAMEAAVLLAELAESDVVTYGRGLLDALILISGVHGRSGHYDLVYDCAERAASVGLRLMRQGVHAAVPELAAVLALRTSSLTVLGRHDEALRSSSEAVDICRELVLADSSANELHYIWQLWMFANARLEAGRELREAIGAAQEAIDRRRELTAQPGRQLPDELTGLMLNFVAGLQHHGYGRTAPAWIDDTEGLGLWGAMVRAAHERGDSAEVEFWLRAAAETGRARAIFGLGAALAERGAETEAEEWLTRAAALGEIGAMAYLGALYDGRDDPARAIRWYRAAAEKGETIVMNELAVLLHRRGEDAEAEMWWNFAAAAGDERARRNLRRYRKHRRSRRD
ncbi:tetratricopeptide repeat protein [Nocardia gipuzkoensis]